MERTILLVDDEANILSALTRLLRPDGYRVLRAGSGREGLELLARNQVGVILSDQRMPEMTGVEFLSKVLELYPDTVRMVLSGYTELNSVTDAINRGAIYRFLTKPWEDDLLRANIQEAFQRYEMKQENARLATELKAANEALEKQVAEKTREISHGLRILEVSQEVLENLPVAVIGIGTDGVVALANRYARELFPGPLLGERAGEVLAFSPDGIERAGESIELSSPGAAPRRFRCWREAMGKASASQGTVLVLVPERQETQG